jgi:hypothetical protein
MSEERKYYEAARNAPPFYPDRDMGPLPTDPRERAKMEQRAAEMERRVADWQKSRAGEERDPRVPARLASRLFEDVAALDRSVAALAKEIEAMTAALAPVLPCEALLPTPRLMPEPPCPMDEHLAPATDRSELGKSLLLLQRQLDAATCALATVRNMVEL